MTRLVLEFARFTVTGGVAAIVHFSVLIGLAELTPLTPIPASAIGFVLAATVSYMFSYYWVFHGTGAHIGRFPRFLMVALTGLGLNTAIMLAAIEGVGLHYVPAQIVATGLVLFWNFSANRLWTFGRS